MFVIYLPLQIGTLVQQLIRVELKRVPVGRIEEGHSS